MKKNNHQYFPITKHNENPQQPITWHIKQTQQTVNIKIVVQANINQTAILPHNLNVHRVAASDKHRFKLRQIKATLCTSTVGQNHALRLSAIS